MRIDYKFTDLPAGGFGVLGNGIKRGLLKSGHILTEDSPDIHLRYGVPDQLTTVPKDRKAPLVFYTVWESSEYPEDWSRAIRKAKVDLILTATEFTRQSLERQGFTSYVWHHGVDERWEFKPRSLSEDGVFRFIHWNAYEWRKGWEIVLRAFIEEFGEDEPVELIMKARDLGQGVWLAPENRPEEQTFLHSGVREVLGHISNEEMVDLIYTSHVGVFPVKGEGWFMPSFEFAASGGAVLLPNKMGLAEQWIEGGYIDIELEGYIKAEPRYPGYMMICSVDDLKKKMRWCFENKQEVFKMGAIASKGVHSRFNWDKIILDLEKYLNKAVKEYED